MTLLLVAFLAGILTVLAPCILPLLPIILGGSIQGGSRRRWAPYIIVTSLAVSVITFTLLLKISTIFIDIPDSFWKILSGGMLIVMGYFMIFPDVWKWVSSFLPKGGGHANRALARGSQKNSFSGDVLVGAALGPVFSSCSPTYLVIIGIVLPKSFFAGFVYLMAYAFGLALILLLVALLGRRVLGRFSILANPQGSFKRFIGVLFVIVGIAVFTGTDKKFESSLLQSGVYDGIGGFEQRLLKTVDM